MQDRKEYIDKMAKQLKAWDDEIVYYQKMMEQKKAEASHETQQELARLKKRREELRSRLDRIRESGDSAWQELKAGIEAGAYELKKALGNAKAKLSQK